MFDLHRPYRLWWLRTTVFALVLLTSTAAWAAPTENLSSPSPAGERKPVHSWETGAGSSHLVPALDILGFDVLLNLYDRATTSGDTYDSDFNSIGHNLTHKWVVDNDPFSTNQFLHPYQGSVYHGAARSAGLDFWQSMGYTFGGSLLWELAGETTPPSINDQVASGIGGSFFGEPLFRMANLLLENAEGRPGFWRELGAAAISPPTGFNRLAFGDRFDPVFPGRRPATYLQLRLGAGLTKELVKDNRARVRTGGASAEFKIIYGLPGKPGYSYERPFDYFDFQFNAVTTNVFESISAHGLLFGKDYAPNEDLRGVWGLYGIYDYFSPQAFRVSSTALAVGTTAQWWLSPKVALQGTGLAGLGYGAAGTIHGTGDRDYHYGLTPEGMLSMRLLFGDVADLDLTGREYFVTDVASSDISGTENILQGDASLTVRIYSHHAVTVKYVASLRDSDIPNSGSQHQAVGTVSLLYTLLSDTDFGALDWRASPSLSR